MKVKTKQKLLLLFVLYTDLEYLRYTWGIEVSGKWQENYSIPDFVTLRRILTSSLCDLEVEVGYPRTGVLWGRSWLRWTVWPTCLLESLDSLSSCWPCRRRRLGSRWPESDRTPLKQFQMIGTMKYICSRPSSVQYRKPAGRSRVREKIKLYLMSVYRDLDFNWKVSILAYFISLKPTGNYNVFHIA